MSTEPEERFPEAIGPYLPLRLLGRGGMAAVYLCVSPQGVEVALKWLERSTGRVVQRFQSEVRALRTLRHPNIVRYVDDGMQDGRPYLVMEYVEGQDLWVYADKLRLRPAHERYSETRRIGVALCDALERVHQAEIVHRDVKPSNVLMEESGRILLSDFGVIRDPEIAERTRAGVLIGTTNYCAPEQLRGDSVDGRADLYGLGCTLFALLTGKPPYPGREREQVVRAHLHEPVPSVSSIDPSVPTSLACVVERLMAKDPDDRPQSAAQAGRLLQDSDDAKAPPPLAGRRRYVDQVREGLLRVQAGEGLVIRSVGVSGSGRSWLLQVVEELAGSLGVPLLTARDKPTLNAGIKRLRAGEALALATRFKVPDDLEVLKVVLDPVGPADLRRTVVSVAPDTPEPHLVAERLYRATAGHPAWLLAVLEAHRDGACLVLPEPLEPPPLILEAVEELPLEALDVLGAIAVLGEPVGRDLVEEVAQVPVRDPLLLLEEEGLVAIHEGRQTPRGELAARAALALLPDVEALHRRAAVAYERRGQPWKAHPHRVALGQASADDAPLDPQQGPTDPLEVLDQIQHMHLRGVLARAREAAQELLEGARAGKDRGLELAIQAELGLILLEQGQLRLAEARLADAVALARAQGRPHARRNAHLWRAVATLDKRPDSRAAASSALDRVGRALNRVEAGVAPEESALAAAIQARCSARVGDRRGYTKALQRAQAVVDLASPILRLRINLQLSRAAQVARDTERAQELASAVVVEAGTNGWKLLAWLGRRALARALGTHPPKPRSLAEGLSERDRVALESKP